MIIAIPNFLNWLALCFNASEWIQMEKILTIPYSLKSGVLQVRKLQKIEKNILFFYLKKY